MTKLHVPMAPGASRDVLEVGVLDLEILLNFELCVLNFFPFPNSRLEI